jgi:hypothetical protein
MEIYTHFTIYLRVQLPVYIFYNFNVLGHVPLKITFDANRSRSSSRPKHLHKCMLSNDIN